MKTVYKKPCVETINMDVANGFMETQSVMKCSDYYVDNEDDILSKDHDELDWSMDE